MLRALSQVADVPAAGAGTMNNTVIGGRGWTYYETVAGGQGASSRGDGPSGVHVGMTNTLNTPIEALELEYPMRVERYELAPGSGGDGLHRGGDGVVRAIRVLEDAAVNLLTDRRRHAPPGLAGGGPGAVGRNLLAVPSGGGSRVGDSAETSVHQAHEGFRTALRRHGTRRHGTRRHGTPAGGASAETSVHQAHEGFRSAPGGTAPDRVSPDGESELPPKVSFAAPAGAVVTLITPGGGGWGVPAH